MKKLLLISMVFGAMPLAMMAQDDDLYFVPKKKSAEKVQDNYGMPKNTYYCGSDRSTDDYNRRLRSTYQVIDGDSTKSDIIDFSPEKGIYPDSLVEDYKLTKQMARFDDYDLSDNVAFWTGYNLGRNDWGWHSTWYYSRFAWYDPWYYSTWRYGWRYAWYDPWYDPWYFGYYGYGGWYDPWYYGYGWGYPYYWSGSHPVYYYGGGGSGGSYAHIGTGTIRRDGSSHGHHRGAVSGNSSRRNSLSERASAMGGNRSNRSNNNIYSNSGNFSGSRSSNSSSSSRGSFGGSRSSGGGFSGGGGSRGGGGGGGSRLGGRR